MTGVVDYVVFTVGILASMLVGIYYAYKDRNHITQFRYHRAGGKLKALPVALSMLVTFESSIFFLGYPSEVYVHGFMFWLQSIGMTLGWSAMLWISIPLFYPLQITSVYEYLHMRHESQSLRRMVVLMSVFDMTIYAAIVSFGAAIALETVTGVNSWIIIFFLVAIATIYTSLGGLKAVIVTDLVQSMVMFGIIFVVLIYGTWKVGGIATVIKLTKPSGRLQLVDFDPDPFTRHTFWSLLIGVFARALGMPFRPQTVQRLNSTRSIIEARRAAFITIATAIVLEVIVMLQGTVAFAYFSDKRCDPLASGNIENPNLIMPYTVMDMFQHIPGLVGLFFAALCSASLSTVSSCLSSTAAIISVDFVNPLMKNASERRLTCISKIVVIASGMLYILFAILVSQIKGPMSQIAGSLSGATVAPILAVFVMSIFFKFTTRKGVYASTVVGFAVGLWLSIGYSFSPGRKQTPWLPLGPTELCAIASNTGFNQTSHFNITFSNATIMPKVASPVGPQDNADDVRGLDYLYSISYCYFILIVTVLAVSVGMIVSKLTKDRPVSVPERLLIKLDKSFFTCQPRWQPTTAESEKCDVLLENTVQLESAIQIFA